MTIRHVEVIIRVAEWITDLDILETIQDTGLGVVSVKTLEDTTSSENQNKTKEKQN